MAMPKRGKKYRKVAESVQKREYTLEEALEIIKKVSYTKFEGSIEFHGVLNLAKNTDPRSIKVQVTFPYPFKQQEVKIAVAVPIDMKEKAKEAGADFYDFDEIKKQIESGKIEFDVLLAVPSVMPELAKYGRELGPKGLMPNTKNGTIVDINNLANVIAEFKRGKQLIKTDKTGVVHFAFGTVNQPFEELKANLSVVLDELISVTGRSKDRLFKKAYLAPTMGPSVKLNLSSL